MLTYSKLGFIPIISIHLLSQMPSSLLGFEIGGILRVGMDGPNAKSLHYSKIPRAEFVVKEDCVGVRSADPLVKGCMFQMNTTISFLAREVRGIKPLEPTSG